MSVEIHRDSLEYVSFPLDTTPVDPALLTHEVAVIDPLDDPINTDWVTVTYGDDQVQILVRASVTAASNGENVTLSVGRWRVWWRAQANPEYPTRNIGLIYVR